MKMNIYAVLDTKVGAFGNLFIDMADAAAIRSWSDGVNESNPKNAWFNHPEDYALYKLGCYDQATGEIIPESKMVCLVTASALKSVKTPELVN